MNAFADWLFGALFGWMGSAANGAWNALVNAGGGISSFFTKYWFLLLLAAVIIGTVLDYAVWLIRWRPYLVWRSWLIRGLRHRRHQRHARDLESADMDDQTRGALAEWVTASEAIYPLQHDADNEFIAQEPIYDQAFDPNGTFAEPYYTQSPEWEYAAPPAEGFQSHHYAQQPGDAPLHAPQPIWAEPAAAQPPQDYSPLAVDPNQPLIDYMQPADYSSSSLYGDGQNVYDPSPAFEEERSFATSYFKEGKVQPDTDAQTRRRRAGRKQRPMVKRLFDDIRERIVSGEDEEGMLDSLPSRVRPEDAFHEAVYPKGYRYRDRDSAQDDERH